MSPATKKYLHSLELAALAGAAPVVLDLLNQPHLDAHTAWRSIASAALGAAWAFFRSNPPQNTAS
jgi:hypothetical protein